MATEKVLFIGAGASYGARKNSNPPLGSQLLSYLQVGMACLQETPRLNLFHCGSYPPTKIIEESALTAITNFLFKSPDETNFENAYISFFHPYYNRRELRALKQFLVLTMATDSALANKIGHFTNELDRYDLLIKKLKIDQSWQIVSLNYDYLFESALLRSGIDFSYIGINDGDFPMGSGAYVKIFKPHGSVNWQSISRYTGYVSVSKIAFAKSHSLAYSENPTVAAIKGGNILWYLSKQNHSPLIAHYSPGKYADSDLHVLSNIRVKALQAITACSEALVIGVNLEVTRQDDDFVASAAKILKTKSFLNIQNFAKFVD